MCSLCFACLHSGLRFCGCNFCYRLFLCKWRECAGQSAGERAVPHFHSRCYIRIVKQDVHLCGELLVWFDLGLC